MDCVLQEDDIVKIENIGRFLVVKTIEFEGKIFHYMIKVKENQDNPEIIFVRENYLSNGELDLIAITDQSLIEKLLIRV